MVFRNERIVPMMDRMGFSRVNMMCEGRRRIRRGRLKNTALGPGHGLGERDTETFYERLSFSTLMTGIRLTVSALARRGPR